VFLFVGRSGGTLEVQQRFSTWQQGPGREAAGCAGKSPRAIGRLTRNSGHFYWFSMRADGFGNILV
jgi:hypothetical protein